MGDVKPCDRRKRCAAIALVLLAGCAREPHRGASTANVDTFPLEGPNGRITLVVPNGMQISVDNAKNPETDAHHAELDLSLREIRRFVSMPTKRAIDDALSLARSAQVEAIQAGAFIPETDDMSDCFDDFVIQPRGKISGVESIAATVQRSPPFNTQTPFLRHRLLGYIDSSAGTTEVNRLLAEKSDGVSVAYYIGKTPDADPIAFVCGNEFSSRLGSCYVHYDISNKISVSYRQCLGALPEWERLQRAVTKITLELVRS